MCLRISSIVRVNSNFLRALKNLETRNKLTNSRAIRESKSHCILANVKVSEEDRDCSRYIKRGIFLREKECIGEFALLREFSAAATYNYNDIGIEQLTQKECFWTP